VADLKVHLWKQQHVPPSNREREVHQDIAVHGFREEHAVLVSSRDYSVLLDGAVRVAGALKKGITKIPAIVVPCATEQD
jgi:ParB-like chromosome segregation protein Spo0J